MALTDTDLVMRALIASQLENGLEFVTEGQLVILSRLSRVAVASSLRRLIYYEQLRVLPSLGDCPRYALSRPKPLQ